ncbi:MAG: hypothetical protein II180_07930 [Proteobacteria bacterium]|nr:hypothetical protein [Pseudomonadota bacterium]
MSIREKERLCKLHEYGMAEVLSALDRPCATNLRGLNPASTAILLAELYRTQSHPILVVAPDDAILAQLAENLAFFSQKAAREMVYVPEVQAGIYSGVAQKRRQVADRIRALHKLVIPLYHDFQKKTRKESFLKNVGISAKVVA